MADRRDTGRKVSEMCPEKWTMGKSIPSKLPMPCGPWSLRGTQGTRAEHEDSRTKPTKDGRGCFPPRADGKARRDK